MRGSKGACEGVSEEFETEIDKSDGGYMTRGVTRGSLRRVKRTLSPRTTHSGRDGLASPGHQDHWNTGWALPPVAMGA